MTRSLQLVRVVTRQHPTSQEPARVDMPTIHEAAVPLLARPLTVNCWLAMLRRSGLAHVHVMDHLAYRRSHRNVHHCSLDGDAEIKSGGEGGHGAGPENPEEQHVDETPVESRRAAVCCNLT